MRAMLQNLFASLPEHIRAAATIEGEDVVLGRHEERRRSCYPAITLTGLPGPWIARTSGTLGERCSLRRLHEERVPDALADFAVRVGNHLGHEWVMSAVFIDSVRKELDVDRSWLLGLAEHQMSHPLPGGIGIDPVERHSSSPANTLAEPVP